MDTKKKPKIEKPTQEEVDDLYNESYYKSPFLKECEICGVEFKYGQSRIKNCGLHKIFLNCSLCGEEFLYNYKNRSGSANNEIYYSLLNEKEILIYCSKSCSNKARFSKGTCPNCKCENVDIYNSRCPYCANKELNCSIICEKHGIQKSSFAGKCLLCHNESSTMKKHYEKMNGSITCKIHGFQEFSSNGNCLLCIDYFPAKNFKSIDDVLYFYNKKNKDYVPWEKFKENFIKNIKFSNIQNILKEGFLEFPTFRERESDDWKGAMGAFEQNLVDKGIRWFIYIKLAKLNGLNTPLVIGKSGSLLVNSSGSDLSFSTNEEDGPARLFLKENKACWNKEIIYLLPCYSESEALEKEKIYGEYFNLLYS